MAHADDVRPAKVNYDSRGRLLRRDGLPDLYPHDIYLVDSFCSRPEIRPASRSWYRERIRQYGAFLADRGRSYLTATAEDYRDFWRWQEEHHAAGNSIDASYRAISAYYRYLHAEGYREDQPLARVPRPGVVDTEPKTYAGIDLRTLLDHFKQPKTLRDWRARVALQLLLETAVRAEELLALTFDDVDHRNLIISVRPSKTHKARTVAITHQVSASIVHYREQLKRSKTLRQCNLLMPSMRGGDPAGVSLTRSGLYQAIEGAFAAAGIDTRSGLHRFRHEALKRLILAGTDLRTVAEIAGHGSVTVTERYGQLWGQERHAIHRAHSPLAQIQKETTKTDWPIR